jgi:hypothetical protein
MIHQSEDKTNECEHIMMIFIVNAVENTLQTWHIHNEIQNKTGKAGAGASLFFIIYFLHYFKSFGLHKKKFNAL